MPLFEYRCPACDQTFEALIRRAETPPCPGCGRDSPERILSAFAVNSDGRSRANLHKARVAFTDSSARRDQLRHEQEEIREHVQEDYGLRVPEPKD